MPMKHVSLGLLKVFANSFVNATFYTEFRP